MDGWMDQLINYMYFYDHLWMINNCSTCMSVCRNMPGLRNRDTWAPLLLKSSHITSCANGYSLGITACLTYVNNDPKPVEGKHTYPHLPLLRNKYLATGNVTVYSNSY